MWIKILRYLHFTSISFINPLFFFCMHSLQYYCTVIVLVLNNVLLPFQSYNITAFKVSLINCTPSKTTQTFTLHQEITTLFKVEQNTWEIVSNNCSSSCPCVHSASDIPYNASVEATNGSWVFESRTATIGSIKYYPNMCK